MAAASAPAAPARAVATAPASSSAASAAAGASAGAGGVSPGGAASAGSSASTLLPAVPLGVASPPPAGLSQPPAPTAPPPSPPPVECAEPVDGDVALSGYPSGAMLVFRGQQAGRGQWGTVCRHYTQDTLASAHVLCRQLGYEKAVSQSVADEDLSALPINLWAVECKAEPPEGAAPGGALSAAHGRSLLRAGANASAAAARLGSAAASAPAGLPQDGPVPRLVDCRAHTCKHIHCGCTPQDALAVTCGGAYAPDYPQCGSAGSLQAARLQREAGPAAARQRPRQPGEPAEPTSAAGLGLSGPRAAHGAELLALAAVALVASALLAASRTRLSPRARGRQELV